MNMRYSPYILLIACFVVTSFAIGEEPVSVRYEDYAEEYDHNRYELISENHSSSLLHNPDYQKAPENPELEIVRKEKVLTGPFMAPQFTADGEQLILTGDNFRGLWLAPRNGSQMPVKITDEYMAGWRPVSTRDNNIFFRTGDFSDNGDVTYTVKSYDIRTGRQEEIYRGRNENIYPPQLSKDGEMIYILRDGDILGRSITDGVLTRDLSSRQDGVSYSDGGRVWHRQVNKDKPVEISGGREACGGEVPSPCGRYIAFLSGDLNAILIHNLQTGEEVNVGEGSNLAWYPDGSLLLYDVTSDDGYFITESDLFTVRPDGTNRQRVTFDSDIAYFNPSWSQDGRYIACQDEFTGEIYLFEVELSGKGDRR